MPIASPKLMILGAMLMVAVASRTVHPCAMDPEVERFLASPITTFASQKTPKGFRIIVLSNLAEYVANLHASGCLKDSVAAFAIGKITTTALGKPVCPYDGDLRTIGLGDRGLYLSHLNVILAAYRVVTNSRTYVDVHGRISRHLAIRTVSSPNAHVPSYAGERGRWPADQSVTLYSIYLYDKVTGDTLSRPAIRKWQRFMQEQGTNEKWMLHKSEVADVYRHSALPRGCALSWTVRYMSAFAPDSARALWNRYVKTHKVWAGVASGFREWPPGIDLPADEDSGPIVLGIGAAASGLALGASRAEGDWGTFNELRLAGSIARVAGGKGLKTAAESMVSRAIELNGATLERWWE